MRVVDRCIIFFCVATLATALARFSWILDLGSQFRVQILLFLLSATVLYVAVRRNRVVWILFATTLFHLPPMLWYILPTKAITQTSESNVSRANILRVMLFNVFVGNERYDDVVAMIRLEQPDLLVTLESHQAWIDGLKPIHKDYPHRFFLSDRGTQSLAVYSKTALQSCEFQSDDRHRFIFLNSTLKIFGKKINLLATHPPTPFSAGSQRMRNEQLSATASAADRSCSRILIGDFNCTPWSPHFKDVLKQGDLIPAGHGRGFQPTWYQPMSKLWQFQIPSALQCTWLNGLKLDHVLHSPDLVVLDYRVGPDLGSDHRPVIVDFQLRSNCDGESHRSPLNANKPRS